MGNVQSESTQESETAKDGEESANPDKSKPDRGPSGAKHELGSRPPGPQAPDQNVASQPLSGEPGGGDRQAGAEEMGKNHSKKSKLKLSSMWAQNSASGGMKEASLCDKDPGAEKRGLACLSRADLQSAGPVFREEPKGLKVPLRSPQAAASDPKDLSAKRAPAKGKGKPENGHPAKSVGGLLLQSEKLAEPGPATDAPKDVGETEVCWTQHVKASAKDCSDNVGRLPESLPSAKKQAASLAQDTESSKMTEDTLAGPQSPNERNASRPTLCNCVAPPGAKALLSWAGGQREKERAGQRDGAPGSCGDSKGLAVASQLPGESVRASSGPVEKPQASGSEVKTGAKSEAEGAEAMSSEMMQDLLERGLNYLYKVTIQPGQWPPSIKSVKQKPSVISSGISYADVLKQCPQKKPPAAAPMLPKALHHLTAAGKKLPPFKGLERSNPEDFSSLSQMFLEHFKKATPPKEPAPHTAGQQVVTFFEELSAGNTKRPEWQRPRPPTPYPQRRKGQGRKLPKFGTAGSQVIAFPKCDWFVHGESQMPLKESAVAAEEGGKGRVDPPSADDKEAEAVGSPQPAVTLLMEQETATGAHETPQKLRRRPQALEEAAKETTPVKSVPPPASAQSLQKEERPLVPLLGPVPRSPRDTLEAPCPAVSAPSCANVGLVADQKAPAVTQARPKVRKQGPTAPRSKEKLKPSGQPKVKAPKGKGQKQWPRGYGMTSPLRLEGVPLFPPFEKVARPFYFGEPLEAPLSLDKPAGMNEDATSTQVSPEQDRETDSSPAHQWPAFQVADSCSRRCYCKHQDQRTLPRNVTTWLNPSTNHLAEPPWVATAMLAVSLVAGTKFCLDSYEQQHTDNED